MATLQDIADRLNISKGTVSKALNGAPDISETLQKTVLETAVEMGYTKIRRQKAAEKKLCILIENVDYKESHQFGYEILLGFRQLAEPAGYTVDIVDTTEKLQKSTPYDVFMLQNQYLGAFVVGFSLNDPWMKDFQTSRTPTVLYDNYIIANPNMAYVGIDNNEGMELAVSHLKKLGHKKNRIFEQRPWFSYHADPPQSIFPRFETKRPKVRSDLCGKFLLYHSMYGKASSPSVGSGNHLYCLQP